MRSHKKEPPQKREAGGQYHLFRYFITPLKKISPHGMSISSTKLIYDGILSVDGTV